MYLNSLHNAWNIIKNHSSNAEGED